jgi:hypothetical protein
MWVVAWNSERLCNVWDKRPLVWYGVELVQPLILSTLQKYHGWLRRWVSLQYVDFWAFEQYVVVE